MKNDMFIIQIIFVQTYVTYYAQRYRGRYVLLTVNIYTEYSIGSLFEAIYTFIFP